MLLDFSPKVIGQPMSTFTIPMTNFIPILNSQTPSEETEF